MTSAKAKRKRAAGLAAWRQRVREIQADNPLMGFREAAAFLKSCHAPLAPSVARVTDPGPKSTPISPEHLYAAAAFVDEVGNADQARALVTIIAEIRKGVDA